MRTLQLVLSGSSLLACLVTFATPASAQLGPFPRQGFTGSMAHSHFVGGSLSNPSDSMAIKAPGPQPGGPVTWNPVLFPATPDYSLEAMFPNLWPMVRVDGHSSGNDDITPFVFDTLTGYWRPQLAQARWMQLTVSVKNSASGAPGSIIRRRTNLDPPRRRTPGADLIGYYFAESFNLDQSLLGKTLLEQASESSGYFDNEDICALDWGLGVLNTSSTGTPPELLFTNEGQYFFTITRDSADLINATLGASAPQQFAYSGSSQVQACGGTIYEMEWDGAQWSQPEVYRSADDLGLDPEVDEVDAVAVNPLSGTVIFSTQYVPGVSQLQVHNAGWTISQPVWDDGFVARKLGANDDGDDIDSVAIIDPGTESPSSFATHIATPVPDHLGSSDADKTMGLSVTRGVRVGGYNGTDSLYLQVSGWGLAAPQKSRVYVYVAYDYDPLDPDNATWRWAGTYLRSKIQDTVDVIVEQPDPFLAATAELQVFRAVAFSANGSLISWSMIGVMDTP